ncbi:MAG TPA: hypothetical protein DEA26_05705 [Oceanospirillales bacterium]|nr:hypothetical protein [Oceanospirillaceae bacterium]HBS42154.1 hypothetical protein [Oceanospirillales bacterium]|tara:strand:- start:1398 stop:1790 length:393 start_codon:yes stop_codon:yes gene_type:complete
MSTAPVNMDAEAKVVGIETSFVRRVERIQAQLRQITDKANVVVRGFEEPFTELEKRIDPYDSSFTQYGFWRGRNGELLGSVQIHQNGQVYAEYDVGCVHPGKPGWFIESATVWGNDERLTGELQCLKMPD